jgi:glycosyltransferase involved in cell wall biosynthesis
MKFTIAIPTYNNVNTIEKAIDSAINQFFNYEFEVLVVDNCSNDGTDKILDNYKGKITRVRNIQTVSLFENHNICIEKAKGDYIIFCHSDDQLLYDALSKYYDILDKRNFPSKYVLWGRSMFRDFYNNWNNAGFYLNEIASGMNSLDVFFGGGLTPSGTCYSRKALLELGGFLNMNHKLAPSDLVTMWKLAINHFEFEMVDRIFFNREFASTASGPNYSYSNIKDSFSDAISCLKSDLPEEKFEVLLEKFKSTTNFSPFLFNVLIENKYLKVSDFRRRLFKEIIKKPFCIRNREIRKMLFY